MCDVKVKKIKGIGPARYDERYSRDPMYIGRSELDSFEMSVYFPSALHVRLMEDPMAQEIKNFGKPGEFERYVADRLRHQMLDFIDGQIKQQVAAIAKANRPKSDDDMQYLFKE